MNEFDEINELVNYAIDPEFIYYIFKFSQWKINKEGKFYKQYELTEKVLEKTRYYLDRFMANEVTEIPNCYRKYIMSVCYGYFECPAIIGISKIVGLIKVNGVYL